MFTIRTLDGPPEDLFNPPFRKVDFAHYWQGVVVSTGLRCAWTVPPNDYTPDQAGFATFMKADNKRSDEERKNLPQNPDKDDVHTPWREALCNQWNHVFYDVSNFLVEGCAGVGHFHPPSHDVFAIDYPRTDDEKGSAAAAAAVKKTWDTRVLLIPAYLDPGVSIRMLMVIKVGEDGGAEWKEEEKTLGTFDGSNTTEIWYLRRDVEVAFHVEGDFGASERRKGVAAVLAVGVLCSDGHGEEVVVEDERQDD